MFNRFQGVYRPYLLDAASDAALFNQAASTAVQGAGIIAQGKLNKRTREWNEKMLQQQRDWSLADWQMQNEYNNPSSQMARLRAAGLNPNLVYGKGADNIASPVSRTSTPSWNPKSPDFAPLANSLFTGYDLKLKEAQYDNLKSQNTVLLQDKLLKEAQTISTLSGAAKTDQDRKFAESLFPGTAEGQRLLNEKTLAETSVILNADERAAAMSQSSLLKAAEEVLSIRAQRANTELEKERIYTQIEGLKKDNRIKELDAKIADNEVRPNQALFMRMLEEIIKGLGKSIKSTFIPPIFNK